jgi:hypothetical protein
MKSKMIDLWADENEPEVTQVALIFRVCLQRSLHFTSPSDELPWIYVEVDKWGVISIGEATRFPVEGYSKDVYAHQREVMDYLVEWELAEWRAIGPEDSELFATEKLTGEQPWMA